MRIYIAGPYLPKNCTLHSAAMVAQQNVVRAIDAFHKIKAAGHIPFVPHLSHFLHIFGQEDYGEWWYEYDNTFITKWAEGIVMLEGWQNSKGSCAELELARSLGIHIFLSVDELLEKSK